MAFDPTISAIVSIVLWFAADNLLPKGTGWVTHVQLLGGWGEELPQSNKKLNLSLLSLRTLLLHSF